MSDRKVRFPAFEALSTRAQALIIAVIEADLTQKQIQEKVRREAGEEISNGSISRFCQSWRQARERESAAAAHAKRLVAAMKASDLKATEMVEAVVRDGMFNKMAAAGEMDIETLIKINRQYEELKIKNRTLDQADEKIRLLERDVDLRERRLERIREEAEQAQNQISEMTDLPDDVKERIRSIYGLAAHAQAA